MLVKTGIYGAMLKAMKEHHETNIPIPDADFIADDFAQVVKYLLKAYSVVHDLDYTDSDVELEKLRKKKRKMLVDSFGKTRMEQDDFIQRLEAYAGEECLTKAHFCPLKVPDFVW